MEGGDAIQKELDELRHSRGRVFDIGENVVTSAGSLKCKHIIHVVGPKY